MYGVRSYSNLGLIAKAVGSKINLIYLEHFLLLFEANSIFIALKSVAVLRLNVLKVLSIDTLGL